MAIRSVSNEKVLTEYNIQNHLFHRMSGVAAMVPNYTPPGWWECDLAVVTRASFFVEYEIKLTLSDLRADAKKSDEVLRSFRRPTTGKKKWVRLNRNKHTSLMCGDHRGPSRFVYVVPESLAGCVPDWSGVYVVQPGKRVHGHVWRKAPLLHRGKVDRMFVRKMKEAAYYRMWNLRCRVPEKSLKDDRHEHSGEMDDTRRAEVLTAGRDA